MKTIRPRFVKAHGLGRNASMGASYQGRCPFCRQSNLAWPSEMKPGTVDGSNRCKHFERIRGGRFVFRKAPSIRVSRAGVAINGVLFKTPHLGNVFCLFDDIHEGSDTFYDERMTRLGVFSHSYAFGTSTNAKFDLIKKALEKRLGFT